jgi:hypothetical protein
VEFVEIVEKPMKILHISKGVIMEISTMIVDIVEIFQRYQGNFNDISTISQFDICNKFNTISTIATISRIIPKKYKIFGFLVRVFPAPPGWVWGGQKKAGGSKPEEPPAGYGY